MKKITLSAIAIALLATSCSKNNSNLEPKPATSTILLTKIIDNTPGYDSYGKPVIEFTYNGKQLTKASILTYSTTPHNQTHIFIYNSSGTLTGTSITQTGINNTNGVVKSVIAASDGKITNIKTYKAGDVLYMENSFTYQNDKLTKWFNPSRVEETYKYDASGNIITKDAVEYSGGKTTGTTSSTTYKSFDDKSNIATALPYWIYFRTYLMDRSTGFTHGNRNPVSLSSGTSESLYSYTYNNYGYPASMTYTAGRTTYSYNYEYIEVK